MEDIITFRDVEAWCLLFGLEESHSGVARTAYDAWFKLIVHRLYVLNVPIERKLRLLIAARMPLGDLSVQYQTTAQMRQAWEHIAVAHHREMYRHESFHLACDCLRLSHEIRDTFNVG